MLDGIISKSEKPPIIFVHGLCHGAWCWDKYKDFFEKNGYECHAFDLQGHGEKEPIGKDFNYRKFHFDKKTATKFDDYLEDLGDEINKCSTKPIVIGHSMGGAIVQKYIENKDDSDRIEAIVLLASVPRLAIGYSKRGSFYIKYFGKMLFKLGLSSASLLSVFRYKKALSDSAFFSGSKPEPIPQKELDEYIEKLGREPFRVSAKLLFPGIVFNNEPYNSNAPVFVVGSRADALFGEEYLKLTAEFYGEKAEIKIFDDMCHDIMLDPNYEKPAEAILDFINGLQKSENANKI